jgi:LmbE family N-acetylglucosaminyl deacetylase
MWTHCWRQQNPCTGPYTKVNQVQYREARSPGSPFAGEALLREFVEILRETKPAMVVYPHPNDAHVDHWAVSAFTTAALEQLRRTDPNWKPPQEWLYIVHRGDWPAPKGYLPHDVLLPPEKLATEVMTTWHEVPLTPEQVERKRQAIDAYKTQTRILHRYMHSFIRTNELFGTIERVELPPMSQWDLVRPDLLQGTLDDGAPPWSGLSWHMVIADPHADTVAREVQRGGDMLRVWAANDGERLYLAVRTSAPTQSPLEFRFFGRGFTTMGGWGDACEIGVFPGGRYQVRQGPVMRGVAVTAAANWTRLDLPLDQLGAPVSVMVNVETRLENLLIDRTAWRLLSLDGR